MMITGMQGRIWLEIGVLQNGTLTWFFSENSFYSFSIRINKYCDLMELPDLGRKLNKEFSSQMHAKAPFCKSSVEGTEQ